MYHGGVYAGQNSLIGRRDTVAFQTPKRQICSDTKEKTKLTFIFTRQYFAKVLHIKEIGAVYRKMVILGNHRRLNIVLKL